MPRLARKSPGGVVFHVLNRGVGRQELFADDGDYAAFERVLAESLERVPVSLLSYCLMPNHWHLVLRPQKDRQLGAFMQLLTTTHVRRWQEHRRRVGWGHVYQGRFKAVLVEASPGANAYAKQSVRYVHLNPVRPADKGGQAGGGAGGSAGGVGGIPLEQPSGVRRDAGRGRGAEAGEAPPWLSLEWLSFWAEEAAVGGDGRTGRAMPLRRDCRGCGGRTGAYRGVPGRLGGLFRRAGS